MGYYFLVIREIEMKNTFRIVAFLEGVSYLLLLFLAVPIKYNMGDPAYVKLLGMPHGILFVAYIILAFLIKDWYWELISLVWTWVTVSIATITTINIDVPPK